MVKFQTFTVKTVPACTLNFEVSFPTFEYGMRRSSNSLQRFAPNVPTFRQNVRANLANFIQDLFWRVKFSDEDIKTVGEGLASLGDRQDLNLSVPRSRCCSKVLGVRWKAKRFISASNLNELKGKGKSRYTSGSGDLLSLGPALPLGFSVS